MILPHSAAGRPDSKRRHGPCLDHANPFDFLPPYDVAAFIDGPLFTLVIA
jgi:hypothetical protein